MVLIFFGTPYAQHRLKFQFFSASTKLNTTVPLLWHISGKRVENRVQSPRINLAPTKPLSFKSYTTPLSIRVQNLFCANNFKGTISVVEPPNFYRAQNRTLSIQRRPKFFCIISAIEVI